MIIGAIEAGGTKFICGIVDSDGNILEKINFPTETPEITLTKVINFFQNKNISAIGLGCFGPIDLNPLSKNYGYITTTPKLSWKNFNILNYLKNHFQVPIIFDTDVNGAAMGEALWGAGKNLKNCIYLTIGTGIGGGALVEGNLVHGLLHPEIGHMFIKIHPEDTFEGICPYHKNCLEGLASGPAIEKRWNMKAYNLPKNHKAWELEAYYLAQGIVNLILTISPEKIILGGGVMKQEQLFPLIRKEVKNILNNYINSNSILENIDNYIVYPELKENAGLLGAAALVLKKPL